MQQCTINKCDRPATYRLDYRDPRRAENDQWPTDFACVGHNNGLMALAKFLYGTVTRLETA